MLPYLRLGSSWWHSHVPSAGLVLGEHRQTFPKIPRQEGNKRPSFAHSPEGSQPLCCCGSKRFGLVHAAQDADAGSLSWAAGRRLQPCPPVPGCCPPCPQWDECPSLSPAAVPHVRDRADTWLHESSVTPTVLPTSPEQGLAAGGDGGTRLSVFPTGERDPLGLFSREGGSQAGCSGVNLPTRAVCGEQQHHSLP